MGRKTGIFGLIVVLSIGLLAGCSTQQADNTDKAASTDSSKVGSDLKSDGNSAENTLQKSADNAKVALSNDATSGSVKQALMSAKDLNTSRLRVDTNGMKVTLSGSVPTADQKKRAGTIAQAQLGTGYSIVNQLTVNPN